MSLLFLTCPEKQKDIRIDTEDKLHKFTIVSWNGGEAYGGRYRCPLCMCVEYTGLNSNQVALLEASPDSERFNKQEISSPILEEPLLDADGIELPGITLDDVIDFHEELEENSKPSLN